MCRDSQWTSFLTRLVVVMFLLGMYECVMAILRYHLYLLFHECPVDQLQGTCCSLPFSLTLFFLFLFVFQRMFSAFSHVLFGHSLHG